MSEAASKLILRQLDHIQARLSLPANASKPRVLLVNPSPGMQQALQPAGWHLTSWVLNAQARAESQSENENEGQCTELFTAELTQQQAVAGVIVNIPKEKQLTVMLLANLRACIPENTPIWLVGHNDLGIRSYLKQQHPGWESWQKLASGNHCQLLQGQLLTHATFSSEEYLQRYEFSINASQALSIVTLPGIFSSGRLDLGTELLLQHLPAKINGRVLDFGCGAGVVSKYLARNYALTELHAVDINVLALAATEHSLLTETVSHRVYASDGLNAVAGKFDWIISNPPFHAGKSTDYKITQNFIHASQQKLTSHGSLVLVANSFLPYREALSTAFKQVRVLHETPKFTVWHATNGNSKH